MKIDYNLFKNISIQLGWIFNDGSQQFSDAAAINHGHKHRWESTGHPSHGHFVGVTRRDPRVAIVPPVLPSGASCFSPLGAALFAATANQALRETMRASGEWLIKVWLRKVRGEADETRLALN